MNPFDELTDAELAGHGNDRVWDCGGSAGEERRVINEVLAELQAEFIETNRDELERFRR